MARKKDSGEKSSKTKKNSGENSSVLALDDAERADLSIDKPELVKKMQLHGSDVGSPEVQVALLTQRIVQLTSHFASHHGDVHSARGMMKLISRRKSLLAYLKSKDVDRYKNLIGTLGLRK